eukprot:CAMPEP_0184753822 /NCGR_PEP_ID=MMETSP0315-20130426/44303_1 /TAXON_ID=101924 /ORGANISM="Rhodosorus marinus, Strain UTEX LB 2760" /LENGTH=151 /DNA_ID=CAMNT_0027233213 /DNA_START=73 /DNA_END=528 /DNA_ORIENTATION=-
MLRTLAGRRAILGGFEQAQGARRGLLSGLAEEVVKGGEVSEVRVSDRCVQRLKEISSSRGGADVALRITVEGGGCSGFQYTFNLEEFRRPTQDEHVFEKDGMKVIVDDVSLPFISGSEVDFEEEMIRTSFKIVDNPNSDSSCSCGSSFSAK